MQIPSMLHEYYKDRSEFLLSQDSSFSDIAQAFNMAFQFYSQNKLWDDELARAKSLGISFDNMLGYPEKRKQSLESMLDTLPGIASDFLGKDYSPEDIEKASIMVNGSSLPLEVRLDDGEEQDTIYIKRFDIDRLLGIELYSLISGIGDYNYAFNSEILIEQKIAGKHEFQYSQADLQDIKNSYNYIMNRVKLDVISHYMGLDDVLKQDNYLLTEGGQINMIDFDVMDRRYTPEDIEACRRHTCDDLQISQDLYDKIYAFEEFLMQSRIKHNKNNINKLKRILQYAGSDTSHNRIYEAIEDE